MQPHPLEWLWLCKAQEAQCFFTTQLQNRSRTKHIATLPEKVHSSCLVRTVFLLMLLSGTSLHHQETLKLPYGKLHTIRCLPNTEASLIFRLSTASGHVFGIKGRQLKSLTDISFAVRLARLLVLATSELLQIQKD